MTDTVFAPLEFKFAEDAPVGVFTGYAAVFGNVDAHGDMIVPKAFEETIAEHKAQGRVIPMHLMHQVYGGDGLPVGVWTNIEEDDKGLRVEGKISGVANTDEGRLLFERVNDGALGFLSIGYKIRRNGVTYGKKPGEPKRILKNLDLGEISLVDDPSNALTRVDEVKAIIRDELKASHAASDAERAVEAIAEAIGLCSDAMDGGIDEGQAQQFVKSLQDAHEALTGKRLPAGMKPTTIREVEKILRDGGVSHSQARAIAEHGIKRTAPRDEADGQANVAVKAALGDLSKALSGFSLPKF